MTTNRKGLTNQAWYSFEKPWGYYCLEDGVLWKRDMDANEHPYGECYRIDDVKGYEHIIADLEEFLK